ncbi:hypothetical protein [Nonlabens sp. Asnod3-A02]|uniref:hypothetical protein n=1 Tax=Nonlabens sp. Asnod3-A02 TaxID=3160579 RepID=UPI00386CA409
MKFTYSDKTVIVTSTSRYSQESFDIQIDDIIAIAILNRMVGDDDSDYIIILTNTFEQFYIHLIQEMKRFEDLKVFLKNGFSIDCQDIDNIAYDSNSILFPKNLKDAPLYQKNIKSWIKRGLDINHPASGVLHENILGYFSKFRTD